MHAPSLPVLMDALDTHELPDKRTHSSGLALRRTDLYRRVMAGVPCGFRRLPRLFGAGGGERQMLLPAPPSKEPTMLPPLRQHHSKEPSGR